MTNLEKYNAAFIEVFGCESSVLGADFCKENIGTWDSIHQLNIISLLEEKFDIMFDPEHIIAFISYEKGKELIVNYGIEILG